MRRKDLEKALRDLGWWFLRHGGKHDVWTDGERIEAARSPGRRIPEPHYRAVIDHADS